jgi:hypothetical protein
MDMAVEDFLDLICGRVPVQKGDSVKLVEEEGKGPRLVIGGGGRKHVDTILLDSDRQTLVEFERRTKGGKLVYGVVFEKWSETEGFRLPRAITIRNDAGGMVQVDVERVWVNPGMKEEQFVLERS